MQIELAELKSKATGERRTILPRIIALLLFMSASLVYFTATSLSRSDRDQARKVSFDAQISESAEQMMRQGKQIFQRQGDLRSVSRSAALYRTRLEYAQAIRFRRRRFPGQSRARQFLSHRAPARTLRAHEARLLPRRALCNFARGGQPL